MVYGTHRTIPGFLFSSGSHGWKGNTVHFFEYFLSVKKKKKMSIGPYVLRIPLVKMIIPENFLEE